MELQKKMFKYLFYQPDLLNFVQKQKITIFLFISFQPITMQEIENLECLKVPYNGRIYI